MREQDNLCGIRCGGELLHFGYSCFSASTTENMKYLILLHLDRGSSNIHYEAMTRTGTTAVVHLETDTWLSRSKFFTCSHPFPSVALLPGIAH